jgi:serine/threonine protein kinase
LRSRLADYQILGPAGPDGDSWRAETPARLAGGGSQVVLTLLGGDGDKWTALSEQLMALTAVRSPYLPRLIEAGQVDEDGTTVQWVAREDGLPQRGAGPAPDASEALRALAAAARGAHDLHEAGWTHGDIRPRSVLQRNGDSLLEPPLRTLARSGPTARAHAEPVDMDTIDRALIWGEGPSRATDIWALGATAHRILTGYYVHPALEKDLMVTAVQRVLVEPPVLAPALPPEVARVLRSCLAADPAERPPTAADLADDFERLAGSR